MKEFDPNLGYYLVPRSVIDNMIAHYLPPADSEALRSECIPLVGTALGVQDVKTLWDEICQHKMYGYTPPFWWVLNQTAHIDWSHINGLMDTELYERLDSIYDKYQQLLEESGFTG